jgi:CHAT domain-containing protein
MLAKLNTRLLAALLCIGLLAAQNGDWSALMLRAKQLSSQGRTTEALPLAEEALRIAEGSFPPFDRRLSASLDSLADLYRDRGDLTKAEVLFKRALAIEVAGGPGDLNLAATLNNLAMLYKDEGRARDAEPFFKWALALYKAGLGPTHPYTVAIMNNMGDLYRSEGRNAEAESFYRGAAFLAEKSLELNLQPAELEYADALRAMVRHNLGELYRSQGKRSEAEGMYQAALEIRKEKLGENHPDTASTMNALALLYQAQGRYADAEQLCRRSLEIRRGVLGENHRAVAYTLATLAWNLRIQHKYAEAEQAYKRAIEIEEGTLGKDDPLLVAPLLGLAATYQVQAKNDDAEKLYRRSLAIRGKQKRLDDAGVGDSLLHLAALDYARDNFAAAGALFDDSFAHLRREFDYQFSYLDEADRLAFLDLVGDAFHLYFSFCYTYRDRDAAIAGKFYDTVLWQKGLVADSIAGVRARLAAAGNPEAQADVKQFATLRTRIAAMQNPPADHLRDWNQTLIQLQDEAHSLERSIVRRVVQAQKPVPPTWHDVQRALAPKEAAVEFVRFSYHDGKGGTDKSYYVALVLKPGESQTPALVPLAEADQLSAALEDYLALVRKAPPRGAGAKLYRSVWKPLESYLEGSKRVYVAPDGLLNTVSLAILPTDDGILLMQKYDLVPVLSSRDLLNPRDPPQSRSIVLVGNPRFDLTEEQQRAALKRLEAGRQSAPIVAHAGPGAGLRSRDPGARALDRLPATEVEVDAIRSTAARKGWQVTAYTGDLALAAAVTRVQHPRVLHIATHGFFEPDQDRIRAKWAGYLPPAFEDPMLHSGLYFAGANRTLAGTPGADGLDDGILTAYEATSLDLHGTELVVLSACETGQGIVSNAEGVFGLRRGLREAGAESILMSLWKVPSEETNELMTLFYDKWMSGMEKHDALRQAQLELRKKVMAAWEGEDHPYFWGAFVLVGR